jgi:hypothetical protein
MRPQASVDLAERRATRARRRRWVPLLRKRAELLPPIQQTHRQDTRPELRKKSADQANRDGVAERFPAPAVQQSLAVDLALLGHYAHVRCDMARAVLKTAKPHDAHTLSRRRTVPGSGAMLRLGLLDAIQDLERFPSGPECVSSCRLGKGAPEAARKRSGPSGTQMGQASLKWAFAEAAVLVLRNTPAGQNTRARLETKHGPGQALTVLAHQLARAL